MVTNAKYANPEGTMVKADFDGVTMFVPADESNRHYREILAAGNIGAYEAPAESVDAWRARCEVTKRQALLSLYAMDDGQTLENIKAAVLAAGGLTQIDWETASTFKRMNSTVLAIQQVMGWTDQQLDALFQAAEQVPT